MPVPPMLPYWSYRWPDKRRHLLVLLLPALGFLLSCTQHQDPQSVYEHARKTFIHGALVRSQREAEDGYQRFRRSSPRWAGKFRTLEAETLLWRGMYPDVLILLDSEPNLPTDGTTSAEVLALRAAAHARLGQFEAAEMSLEQADRLCTGTDDVACGYVSRAHGVLANQRGQSVSARKFFLQSLSIARNHSDRLSEATALMNLGAVSLREEHLDEALDASDAAYRAAETMDAQDIAQNALGNLGWAYYKMGDPERALSVFLEAEKRADGLGDDIDRLSWIMDAGYVFADLHDPTQARKSYLQALEIAQKWKAKQEVFNALHALAGLALQTGDLEKANNYAGEALNIARDSQNHVDELYPLLVQGQVAASSGDVTKAREMFEAVEQDNACPVFLKWEAQHSLARLDDPKYPEKADREYRAALATFESARSAVQSEDFQLSFLTNAAHIYDDYVHFLVAQGKPDEALRWADYSRARTLSEGLLSKGTTNTSGPPTLNPREISRRAKGVLLFYWLGEKQSYLWAITPQKTTLFQLPPGVDVEAMVQRYRTALKGPQDVLEFSEDGRALYRTLIAPAKSLLAKDAKVFIMPDGSLNNLNFETLIVADPKPHFWIDDANVTNASSLRVLNASFAARNPREIKQPRRLLLIGDNVTPSKEFPELPQAGQQMTNVAKHFPANQEQIYQRAQATPSAYLNSGPENFSHIHFVAHGTASRLSPLDSAIVLSKGAGTDSFKLYARDIVPHHLRAELVTISSCNSAGERAYTGEGLVGLAWAFLRAGAHNVIAGLWEVSDAPTEQLMDRFYNELDKGLPPDVALRTAKLSLLHDSPFRNPFYWAPFQLYTGS